MCVLVLHWLNVQKMCHKLDNISANCQAAKSIMNHFVQVAAVKDLTLCSQELNSDILLLQPVLHCQNVCVWGFFTSASH